MKCKRCGLPIPDNMLACMHCARVAQVLGDREKDSRSNEEWFNWIHEKPWAKLWLQIEILPDDTQIHHFAMSCSIDYKTFSFCGLNIGAGQFGDGHRMGSGGQVRPDFTPDPRNCPLCWDRLMNRGGGICAQVCLICGGRDSSHEKGCYLRLPAPGEKLPMEKPSRKRLLSDEFREISEQSKARKDE